MSRALVISVLGPDRPGIVAAMSRVMFDLGCNFVQVGSTILGGHFAMTMHARCADDLDESLVRSDIAAASRAFDLQTAVKIVPEDQAQDPATHAVSLAGADKPGIVYRVADTLAGMGINILDLDLRVQEHEGNPTCSLEVSVRCPPSVELEIALPPLREELGTDVHVRRVGMGNPGNAGL